MKERLLLYAQRYGQLVAFPAFYLVCLATFASLTFPYEKLKDRIVFSFNDEQRATGGQQELQIESLSGYWLSGVRMNRVDLFMASSEPGKPPTKIEIDQATLRYSILSALVGSGDLDFTAEAFGGTISGSYDAHGHDKSFEASLEGIDVGKITPLVQVLGVPLDGRLGGSVRLTLPEGKASKAAGALSLESKGTAVGDGKAKLKGALTLPRLDVGTITLAADVKDGVVKITKFVSGGKDLDLQGDGRVTLREQVADALCDVQVRFRVNDVYRGKSEFTKLVFGAPGSSTAPAFELDPKVKQSKRADGFYGWTVRGPVTHIDFAPAPH
jgi:type II secretion system protein N